MRVQLKEKSKPNPKSISKEKKSSEEIVVFTEEDLERF
jgi:hypothetical protein